MGFYIPSTRDLQLSQIAKGEYKVFEPITEKEIDYSSIINRKSFKWVGASLQKENGERVTARYYSEDKQLEVEKYNPKFFKEADKYLFTKENIKDLEIINLEKRQDGSIVGRSILGGIIAGETGAVIGGMSALKDTNELSRVILINNKFQYFIKESDYNRIKEFFDYLSIEFLKERKAKQLKEKEKASDKEDPIEMLKRLKELMDLGIITQEEYNEKRKKFLNQI